MLKPVNGAHRGEAVNGAPDGSDGGLSRSKDSEPELDGFFNGFDDGFDARRR